MREAFEYVYRDTNGFTKEVSNPAAGLPLTKTVQLSSYEIERLVSIQFAHTYKEKLADNGLGSKTEVFLDKLYPVLFAASLIIPPAAGRLGGVS